MIEPMLCKEEKNLDGFNEDWICQDKLDGCRAILYSKDGIVQIQGRNCNLITNRYPDIEKAFPKFNCILDGEIITQDEDFNHLQFREQNNKPFKVKMLSQMYPARFMAFDVLEYEGKNVACLPLRDRLKLLEKMRHLENEFIRIVPAYKDIKKRFQWAKDNEKEGIIVKSLDSFYEPGKRSSAWLKVKNWKEEIISFDKYELNNAGITVENAQGTRVLVAGSQSQLVKNAIDSNGFAQLEVQFLEKTKNGRYRMSTCKRVVG
jgi:ATP-dependent DNA ligase